QCRPRMPRVEAGDLQAAAPQLVHQPRCHRAGLDPDLGIVSGLATNNLLDPLGNRRALASP
ncbi:MAG TPA: hypothetical protein VLX09_24520, partial [Stellaceae bacterium]|nr:hypothetical protein [Stellaceae bacterium]